MGPQDDTPLYDPDDLPADPAEASALISDPPNDPDDLPADPAEASALISDAPSDPDDLPVELSDDEY